MRQRTQFYISYKSIKNFTAIIFSHRTIIRYLSAANNDIFIYQFVHCAFQQCALLSMPRPVPGLILRKILDCTGGDIYGERATRAYNVGLRAEPPARSRGRAPGQGVRGRSPPEADNILAFER